MHLDALPYNRIVFGTKRIEMRLFDEKREQIGPGDEIEFFLAGSENESFVATVEKIDRYGTFEDLLQAYSRIELGCSEEESSKVILKLLRKIYTKKQEALAGVVAIRIKL